MCHHMHSDYSNQTEYGLSHHDNRKKTAFRQTIQFLMTKFPSVQLLGFWHHNAPLQAFRLPKAKNTGNHNFMVCELVCNIQSVLCSEMQTGCQCPQEPRFCRQKNIWTTLQAQSDLFVRHPVAMAAGISIKQVRSHMDGDSQGTNQSCPVLRDTM